MNPNAMKYEQIMAVLEDTYGVIIDKSFRVWSKDRRDIPFTVNDQEWIIQCFGNYSVLCGPLGTELMFRRVDNGNYYPGYALASLLFTSGRYSLFYLPTVPGEGRDIKGKRIKENKSNGEA